MGTRAGAVRGSHWLLASSSAVALLIAGGAPSAYAACNTSYTGTTAPGCINSGTITGIAINNSTITSDITNSGTISANGIVLSNGSTITGGILDANSVGGSATIIGGILISDSLSKISAGGSGIQIGGTPGTCCGQVFITTFGGGISNAGTISAGLSGIFVGGKNSSRSAIEILNFTGGISNIGTISAAANGIFVGGTAVNYASLSVSNFSGNISNAGTITANNGIVVGGQAGSFSSSNVVSTFAGSITNSGTIVAVAHGIVVGRSGGSGTVTISTFTGGVTNSGMISTSGTVGAAVSISADTIGGSVVNAAGGTINGQAGAISVSAITFAGGISNAGLVLAHTGSAVDVAVGTFAGSISNGGTISAAGYRHGIFVNGGTFGSGITNSGTIASGRSAIELYNVQSFAGGIVNSAGGLISASVGSGGAIYVSQGSYFQGGITNAGTVSYGTAANGIVLRLSTFVGNISNSGTITGSGYGAPISVSASTFSGNIVNGVGGLITSSYATGANGIFVTASSFLGAITNAGTISVGAVGIFVVPNYAGTLVQFGSSSAGGGIVNSGSITAAGGGIIVGASYSNGTLSSFAGGVTNSGTISALGTYSVGSRAAGGILVGGIAASNGVTSVISTFAGGVINSSTGLIVALGNGIQVGGVAIANGASVTISAFSGGVTNQGMISAGAVGIQVGGSHTASSSVTISTFSGGVTNSGTISANFGIEITNVQSFVSGAVSNAGKITATTGLGIAVYNATQIGTNSAGGSIVNSGTIVAPTGILVENVATILGHIVNSGTITGTGGTAIDISNGPNNMTIDVLGGAISGNIVGSGSGAGDAVNFTLGAGNTFVYSGTISGMHAVNVNSGTLFDSGAVSLGGVIVNAGGTLAPGTPGLAGSALHITGSLAFASGAFYLDTISGGTASKTTVTGSATLGGASVQVASGSTVTTGHQYTILTDTGGGLGGSNVFNPNVISSAAYKGTLSYDADDVFLTFALNSLAPLLPPGAPANDVAVANAIDNFLAGGGTPPSGFSNLFNLTGAQLQTALTKLDGEDGTGAQTGAFTLMTELLNLMFGDNSGGGGGGLGFAPDTASDLPPDIALAYDAILKAQPKQTFDQRWSAWGSGFGGTSITDGNAAVGSNTVTATTYGSAAGMEYRPDPNTKLGFALAGGGLNWGLAQGLGTGRADAFQAGVYGKSTFGAAYLEGGFAFGNEWFTTNRTAAFGDQLTATFQGQSYALRGEAGYRYALPMSGALVGVTPYGALQTQWFHTPAYSETDLSGGGFALAYNANTANDTRSELGARFDDLTTWNNKPLMLRASLAWAHDWVSGTGLNAAFQTLPGSGFTVNGAAVPPNSALTSASAQYFLTPALSFTAKFDGEFAPTSQTYAGSGTLKYTW